MRGDVAELDDCVRSGEGGGLRHRRDHGHAAIVAREYGLPAVVGTGVATTLIKTGQRVRVDGDTGIVTVLE